MIFICYKFYNILVVFFRTFVHPHIEYASSAYIPHLTSHLTTLGSIQRWFTKQIPGVGGLSFEEREALCGLEPVADRIRRGITIETYKIASGTSGVRGDILSQISHSHETRGRAAGNFAHIKPKKDIRKFSFAAVAPVLWESVNDEARSATTLNSFKNNYDRQNLHAESRAKLF